MTGVGPRAGVVTGAGGGIGQAIALALAERGASVWLVGRTAAALEDVASQAEGAPGGVAVQPTDLTVDDEVQRLAAAVEQGLPELDLLVHSAGVIAHGPLSEAPVEDLDLQYAANVRAPYLLTQRLLPLLVANRGQVVFVNSSVGLTTRAEVSAFAATQHALKAIADSLREEVNADGVRVLTVFPGRTATSRQERIHRHEGKEYRPERLMQPEDVAAAILNAVELPRTAEVTDLRVRPFQKPA